MGIELTTLVVIGTDCTGSKSNYHTIVTTPFMKTIGLLQILTWVAYKHTFIFITILSLVMARNNQTKIMLPTLKCHTNLLHP